jgi:hypothetical protein
MWRGVLFHRPSPLAPRGIGRCHCTLTRRSVVTVRVSVVWPQTAHPLLGRLQHAPCGYLGFHVVLHFSKSTVVGRVFHGISRGRSAPTRHAGTGYCSMRLNGSLVIDYDINIWGSRGRIYFVTVLLSSLKFLPSRVASRQRWSDVWQGAKASPCFKPNPCGILLAGHFTDPFRRWDIKSSAFFSQFVVLVSTG